jgi:hypothetical protein
MTIIFGFDICLVLPNAQIYVLNKDNEEYSQIIRKSTAAILFREGFN